MELGDRNLVVQRASVGSEKKAQAIAATSSSTPALPTAEGGDAGEPTSCMVLLNMVTPEELQDDDEYAEIVADIRDECTKYGNVIDVRIPRPAKESKGALRTRGSPPRKKETGEGGRGEGVCEV